MVSNLSQVTNTALAIYAPSAFVDQAPLFVNVEAEYSDLPNHLYWSVAVRIVGGGDRNTNRWANYLLMARKPCLWIILVYETLLGRRSLSKPVSIVMLRGSCMSELLQVTQS